METPQRVKRNLNLKNVEHLTTPVEIPPSPSIQDIGDGAGVNVNQLERSPKCGQVKPPQAEQRVSERLNTSAHIYRKRIQEEAANLRKLSHPNIIGFREVAEADQESFDSLVSICCKTSMGRILESRNKMELGPLPAQHCLKMIEDIARALDYLHTEENLLHGDLKSFNILVEGEFDLCKLCNFGISLPMSKEGLIDFKQNSQMRRIGTNIWSAPEVIDEEDVIDCKADIFSFGLVIYETIALVPPHKTDMAGKKNTGMENSDEACNFLEKLEDACGTRPPLPQAFELSESYNHIVELFYICTNELAEDRPMAKIIWQSVADKRKGG